MKDYAVCFGTGANVKFIRLTGDDVEDAGIQATKKLNEDKIQFICEIKSSYFPLERLLLKNPSTGGLELVFQKPPLVIQWGLIHYSSPGEIK